MDLRWKPPRTNCVAPSAARSIARAHSDAVTGMARSSSWIVSPEPLRPKVATPSAFGMKKAITKADSTSMTMPEMRARLIWDLVRARVRLPVCS